MIGLPEREFFELHNHITEYWYDTLVSMGEVVIKEQKRITTTTGKIYDVFSLRWVRPNYKNCLYSNVYFTLSPSIHIVCNDGNQNSKSIVSDLQANILTVNNNKTEILHEIVSLVNQLDNVCENGLAKINNLAIGKTKSYEL